MHTTFSVLNYQQTTIFRPPPQRLPVINEPYSSKVSDCSLGSLKMPQEVLAIRINYPWQRRIFTSQTFLADSRGLRNGFHFRVFRGIKLLSGG
ncbi:hypothetical protein CDAR_118181 [Caerostris darwini]|uniref:Uncharacterized protein n=1 Tax=Caerostris darwini TaxID=1538125 RepID=A0AAV4TES3_9ARAC|nr:hypothetical protein CDAR_118181 [Caerostris darwini]